MSQVSTLLDTDGADSLSQAAEDARLDIAEPALDKLHDAHAGSAKVAQEAEIIISGTEPSDPVVWR